jgi:hypothetical protein
MLQAPATPEREDREAAVKEPVLVIIESPYGDEDDAIVERNVLYARRAMRDSFNRGEAPWASHLLYPQTLCDRVIAERLQGIEAGLAWGRHAEKTVVYTDYGITAGMRMGIERAQLQHRPVEYREIGK